MKKIMMLTGAVIFAFSLAACSSAQNSSSNSSSGGTDSSADYESASSDAGKFGEKSSSKSINPGQSQSTAMQEKANPSDETSTTPTTKRMVIYNANMQITVSDFQASQDNIQALITQIGGYIVQSSFSKTETGHSRGTITARIPQPKFQSFMDKVGQMAGKVENRSIHGQDVTKHYVDLQSHLKAKMAVKQRLESFLKKSQRRQRPS